jgi:putative transposase
MGTHSQSCSYFIANRPNSSCHSYETPINRLCGFVQSPTPEAWTFVSLRGVGSPSRRQNRYKSILCQEDTYLQELVRYIHLNPLRAKVVKTLTDSDKYPYSGHSALMGKIKRDFQDTDYVLGLFGKKVSIARKAYRVYVKKGIAQGRRPELVGGGLIRSAGGWSVIKAMRQVQDHMKSDERILGDGDFTQAVLDEAKERLKEHYLLRQQGYDLEKLTIRVSTELGVEPKQVWAAGKHPITVKARSLMCYWAVRKLGYSATELIQKAWRLAAIGEHFGKAR